MGENRHFGEQCSTWTPSIAMFPPEHGVLQGTSYRNKPTLEVTEAEYDRVFNVNVKSIFHSVLAVVPQMIMQNHTASIINVASIGAFRPRPGLVWYNSSKGAVANVSPIQVSAARWQKCHPPPFAHDSVRQRKASRRSTVPIKLE